MRNKHNKLLHYLLIMLMVMAPVRGSLAMQADHCDPGEATMAVAMNEVSPEAAEPAIQEGSTAAAVHQCCCCDNSCVDDCDMGVSLSILMQSEYISLTFVNASNHPVLSTAILARALTPPNRPPAQFS